MPELIACLSTGKGTWGHVSHLIRESQWDKVLLITNDYGKENFKKTENSEFIVINASQGLKELKDEIKSKLEGKIQNPEVALNIVSGSGKEHMALISAILQLGLSLRLMAVTKEGIEEV
jgi:hypothetical protein